MTKKIKTIPYEDAKKMEDEINAKFREWNDALEKYGCRFVKTLLIDDNSIEPLPLIHSADIVYKIKDGFVSSKIKDRINGL